MSSMSYKELRELICSTITSIVCARCRQYSQISGTDCRRYDCHHLYEEEARVIIEKLVEKGAVKVEMGEEPYEDRMDTQCIGNDGHGNSVSNRAVDGNAPHSEIEYRPLSEDRLEQCLNCIHIVQNMSITKAYVWFCKKHRMSIHACGICKDFNMGFQLNKKGEPECR